MTRIMIVDDHEVVRLGIAALLQRRERFQVVGEAGSIAETLELIGNCQPDIVIMDLRLPDGSGVELCREIRSRYSNIKVIMLTSYADDEAMVAALMAGAEGYVLKMIGSDALMDALESVSRGEPLIDPTINKKLLEFLRRRQAERQWEEALTDREKTILLMLAEGKTNKEIANELYLSEKTVRNHVSNILNKLGLANRTQAAAYVLRNRT
ncbi:MAG: response regulator [Bacillota bacterium]